MKHTEKFLRQRRFLLMLPVLATPFLTLLFWTLGGGQGAPAQTPTTTPGLNVQVPPAHFPTQEVWDKLSLYELAAADSARYREARESDPYFDLVAFTSHQQKDTIAPSKLIDTFKQKNQFAADPKENEKRVTQKLQQLYSEINKQEAPIASHTTPAVAHPADPQFTEDVNRLQQMMEMLQADHEPDPEMQQIENVLEKILDIQHPQRMQEKLKTTTRPTPTLPVSNAAASDNISLLQPVHPFLSADTLTLISPLHTPNGFFGLDAAPDLPQAVNTIAAVVHDTQELVAGATIKLRLTQPIEINGYHIPKDQFVFGLCAIQEERLTIRINAIHADGILLPVALEAHDLDGLPGIYIPGAITRDAAKQASESALQNMQLMTMDPSLGTQAALAGVEAAKGLFTKKAKLIRVTVKAGYQLLLTAAQQNTQS